MKRLLIILLLPFLFIFACDDDEDKDETYFFAVDGICFEAISSDEKAIDEIIESGYTKGSCNTDDALAKCVTKYPEGTVIEYYFSEGDYYWDLEEFESECLEYDGTYSTL
ncbi:MAG: hypothetical protein PF637_06415 [Spirochaetes bacterium]|jgi:hypothetical protein|nr:hypothetical protein [Spirochaetota bacterium]